MSSAGDDAGRSDEERRMADDVMVRPELISLQPDARQRVVQQIAAKGGHCGSCGATNFEVGHALYLGFLFLDEDDDAYMVALSCGNPDCAGPRTAIVLAEKAFLSGDEGARATG
jgi:hypothetical protein